MFGIFNLAKPLRLPEAEPPLPIPSTAAHDLEFFGGILTPLSASCAEAAFFSPATPRGSPSGGKGACSDKLKIRMSAMSDPPLVE